MTGSNTESKTEVSLRYNVYVIELDQAVLNEKKFRAANPGYEDGKPCVYVGMTANSPQVRFEQHRNGYKAAKFVRKYGLRLRPRQFRNHNPMTWKGACEMEKEKARRLRNRGWGVWQN